MTSHYRLDPSASSVVVICSLCDWRGLGLDRDDAQAQAHRHIIAAHPRTQAADAAERGRQRHRRAS
jgi:hypothetical protein